MFCNRFAISENFIFISVQRFYRISTVSDSTGKRIVRIKAGQTVVETEGSRNQPFSACTYRLKNGRFQLPCFSTTVCPRPMQNKRPLCPAPEKERKTDTRCWVGRSIAPLSRLWPIFHFIVIFSLPSEIQSAPNYATSHANCKIDTT